MLWADISESRIATNARPVGERSKLSTPKVLNTVRNKHRK